MAGHAGPKKVINKAVLYVNARKSYDNQEKKLIGLLNKNNVINTRAKVVDDRLVLSKEDPTTTTQLIVPNTLENFTEGSFEISFKSIDSFKNLTTIYNLQKELTDLTATPEQIKLIVTWKTVSTTTVKVYLNGNLIRQQTVTDLNFSNLLKLVKIRTIRKELLVDFFTVYDRELTATEVKQNYYSGI